MAVKQNPEQLEPSIFLNGEGHTLNVNQYGQLLSMLKLCYTRRKNPWS
jgi:hypothetical protein